MRAGRRIGHDQVHQPRPVVELGEIGGGDVDVPRNCVAVESAKRERVVGRAPFLLLGQVELAGEVMRRPVAVGDSVGEQQRIRRDGAAVIRVGEPGIGERDSAKFGNQCTPGSSRAAPS